MARDLRSWLARLETEDELKRVTVSVDPKGEVAEICRRVREKGGFPLLFENISGYESTWCRRMFTGGIAHRSCIAMMLGERKDISADDIQQLLQRRFREPVPPVSVPEGPVKENVIQGGDVDLYQIPVPLWHPQDGGPYLNTMCATVTRNPDTGRHNLGQYRAMIVGRDRLSTLLIPSKGWGTIYDRYRQLAKSMPVAIVIGWDQSMVFTAGIPMSQDEYTVMGALMQEPVPLVKCETSDIEVPASAEIVIEGTISPDPETYEVEGPFGEAGCYSVPQRRPVIQVDCITHRHDPIYRGALTGIPIPGAFNDEMYIIASCGIPPLLRNILEDQDIPGVVDLQLGSMTVVRIRKTYQGQARQIAAAIWGSRPGLYLAKIIVVVEDDIDIRNPTAVQAAIAQNVNPSRGVIIYPMQAGSYADPALSMEEKDEQEYDAGLQDRLLIDATVDWTTHPRHMEWDWQRVPPSSADHFPEMLEKVDHRLNDYGVFSD